MKVWISSEPETSADYGKILIWKFHPIWPDLGLTCVVPQVMHLVRHQIRQLNIFCTYNSMSVHCLSRTVSLNLSRVCYTLRRCSIAVRRAKLNYWGKSFESFNDNAEWVHVSNALLFHFSKTLHLKEIEKDALRILSSSPMYFMLLSAVPPLTIGKHSCPIHMNILNLQSILRSTLPRAYIRFCGWVPLDGTVS